MWNRCSSSKDITSGSWKADKSVGEINSWWMSTCSHSTCRKKRDGHPKVWEPLPCCEGTKAIGTENRPWASCFWLPMTFADGSGHPVEQTGGVLRAVVSQIVPQKLQQGPSGRTAHGTWAPHPCLHCSNPSTSVEVFIWIIDILLYGTLQMCSN